MLTVTWTNNAYGYEGALARLNTDRNDLSLRLSQRKAAHKAYEKLQARLQDKRLMAYRERLIRAARAKDERAMALIQQQMRSYLGEDPETGSYEQD